MQKAILAGLALLVLAGCAPATTPPAQIAIYQELYSVAEIAAVTVIIEPEAKAQIIKVSNDFVDEKLVWNTTGLDKARAVGVVRVSPYSLPIGPDYRGDQQPFLADPGSDHGFISFVGVPTPAQLIELGEGYRDPVTRMIGVEGGPVFCALVMWNVPEGDRTVPKGILEISLERITRSENVSWPKMGFAVKTDEIAIHRAAIANCFAEFQKELGLPGDR